jgi:hypothetical protein
VITTLLLTPNRKEKYPLRKQSTIMEGYFHGGKITKGKKGRKKFYVL